MSDLDQMLGRLMEAVENIKRAIDRQDADITSLRSEVRSIAAQVNSITSTLGDMQAPVQSFVAIRERFSNLWWVAGLGITAVGTVVGPALYEVVRKMVGR